MNIKIIYPNDKIVQELNTIYFFSDEWDKRRSQCESFVQSKEGKYDLRVAGRKCSVQEIPADKAKLFINQNHIQKANNLGIVFFGLIHQNELLGVLSLGRHNRKTDHNLIVLDRLCFKQKTQVIGGSEKLFKSAVEWASRNKYDEIITFSDNRYTNGLVYERLGFILDKKHKPDYSYFSPNGERLSKQSQKKSASKCPDNLTELEWATQRGFIRSYDLGRNRWSYSLHESISLKEKLSKKCAEQHAQGVFKHSHIRGYYKSDRLKKEIYFSSSYELRCLFLLDQDESVLNIERCPAIKINNRWRNPDLLITRKDSTEIIEVKPNKMLTLPEVTEQISDTIQYCKDNNYNFTIWSEQNSQLENEKEIIKWARMYLKDKGDPNYYLKQKENNLKRAKKYYKEKIATNTIKLFCEFCQTEHEALKITYDKNIARNGRYICEKEGGKITGSRPKKKKENPYALEGNKQCNECLNILPFNMFGTDKYKSDGYATRCKKCRNKSE